MGAMILRLLHIDVNSTPNPSSLKFHPVGKLVMGDQGTMDFSHKKFADCSPLADEIFDIDGVKRVFYGNNFITVSKEEELDWDGLKEEIK
jgi:hypothetical protein